MPPNPIYTVLCIAAIALAADAQRTVEVVVHRGANEYAPENTFAAAKKCIEIGVDYIEIDVRRSEDGVHYILHDRTLDRTTNGAGPIRELSSEEIDRLDAGSWFDPRFKDERVPRLEDYLEWAQGKVKIYFDVKDADLETLIALTRQYGFADACFFWFGNRGTALKFRELAPDLPLKINASTPEAIREAKQKFDMQIIECGVRDMTDELFAVCRELDLKVMVRQGRNDADAFRVTIEKGADMINLDHPDAFLKVQSEVLGGE